jgi:hypothetical protein
MHTRRQVDYSATWQLVVRSLYEYTPSSSRFAKKEIGANPTPSTFATTVPTLVC